MEQVRRHWKAFLAAFLVAWAPVLVYWPLGFFVWLPFGLWLFSRRWWLAPLSVVLTPAVVIPGSNVGSAVVAYASGTAELRTYGMPDPEFFNLDPTWRMHWRTRGCVIDGTEALTDEPYNATLKLLVTVFGPMPGAYDGPIPERAAAWAALDAGEPTLDGLSVTQELGHVVLRAGTTEVARYTWRQK
ncbi:MAG: hypothetical protein H6738_18280 [Alphaproteobacteria bacterium]|nr:hypothetical protein [Alphaproteobacteria bacterium]